MIIIPDPTPEFVQSAFYNMLDGLELALEKDSVRCFLRLFAKSPNAMAWNLSITSDTLTCMVSHNALRCAKVVLPGKASWLNGHHANPNCMNPHGYFPIHGVAERFSVNMIKLLFHHGALAKVHTLGDVVIQNLLPLHVAVENTCMHKYLEDSLPPMQYHRDYIYKLVHLLCLLEMKIFLDTVRLAGKTDNLVHEIWNYIMNGKLVQATVLLLASQNQIRKHDCIIESLGCIPVSLRSINSKYRQHRWDWDHRRNRAWQTRDLARENTPQKKATHNRALITVLSWTSGNVDGTKELTEMPYLHPAEQKVM
ncbi:uncharacterized protein LOC119272979 [Triticum dicoccoides]|uniref:uncharacterized protein LOC119272979 n=1 Tax=Triticum dicoccoides TaxID=85692 RepID=UPI00188F440E|nr:uncharacterized protein LOC119272979 [Triticum dicoccoides]